MKVLQLAIVAKLPDDFAGDLNDALRYIADRRAEEGSPPRERSPRGTLAMNAVRDVLWEPFSDALKNGQSTRGLFVAFEVDTPDGAKVRDEALIEQLIGALPEGVV